MERCVGLQAHTADFGIEFFEPSRGPAESAARPESRYKMRDAPGSLLPDLVGRGEIVRLPIRGIAVLIRVKISLRSSRDAFLRFATRAVSAFIAGSDHKLRAERRENAFPLVRSAVPQAKLHRKTERRADHCVGNAGVAAGSVNDGFAGSQRPA